MQYGPDEKPPDCPPDEPIHPEYQLCEHCSSITYNTVLERDGHLGHPHHLSLSELRTSSQNGCHLCTLVWHGFLNTNKDYNASRFVEEGPTDRVYLALAIQRPENLGRNMYAVDGNWSKLKACCGSLEATFKIVTLGGNCNEQNTLYALCIDNNSRVNPLDSQSVSNWECSSLGSV
jgi:hypothetical protein